ncbi:MAG: hypothetical protein WBC05_01550 [Sedimentisphaerales bacterium]
MILFRAYLYWVWTAGKWRMFSTAAHFFLDSRWRFVIQAPFRNDQDFVGADVDERNNLWEILEFV